MEERGTFIQFGDLLLRLAEQCRLSAASLEGGGGGERSPDNREQFAKWVAQRQHRLAEDLARCVEECPENLINRRVQYQPGFREWQSPDGLQAALAQTVDLNSTVAGALQTETDKSSTVETGGLMQDLSRQVDAVNRKVSLALVTSQDL